MSGEIIIINGEVFERTGNNGRINTEEVRTFIKVVF